MKPYFEFLSKQPLCCPAYIAAVRNRNVLKIAAALLPLYINIKIFQYKSALSFFFMGDIMALIKVFMWSGVFMMGGKGGRTILDVGYGFFDDCSDDNCDSGGCLLYICVF